jgi:hypothetical protein
MSHDSQVESAELGNVPVGHVSTHEEPDKYKCVRHEKQTIDDEQVLQELGQNWQEFVLVSFH